MTPDRIEAAARAYYAEEWDYASEPGKEKARGRIRRAIDAAYPELGAVTHWVAPMEATEEMLDAYVEGTETQMDLDDDLDGGLHKAGSNIGKRLWTAMRQAYLKDT